MARLSACYFHQDPSSASREPPGEIWKRFPNDGAGSMCSSFRFADSLQRLLQGALETFLTPNRSGDMHSTAAGHILNNKKNANCLIFVCYKFSGERRESLKPVPARPVSVSVF